MKAKEHLLACKKIEQITRGRISNANHEFLAEEWANGVRFSDWEPKGEVKSSPAKSIGKAKSKPVVPEISEYFEPWPESEYVAYERRDGKKFFRSMREACNNCGVSLTQCWCGTLGRDALIASTNASGPVAVFVERK